LELRIFKSCRKEFHLRIKFTSINNVYFTWFLLLFNIIIKFTKHAHMLKRYKRIFHRHYGTISKHQLLNCTEISTVWFRFRVLSARCVAIRHETPTPRVLYTQTSSRNVCYKRVSRRKKRSRRNYKGEGETRNNGCGVFRAEPFVTPRCERFSQRVERDRGMYSGESTTNQPPIWFEANTGNGLYSLIGSLLMYSVIRSHFLSSATVKLAHLSLLFFFFYWLTVFFFLFDLCF